MAKKSVIKLNHIYSFFDREIKLITKGENAYESNHVKNYIFDGDLHIDGQVHASMKNTVYNVEIVLEKDGGIQTAECTCPRGKVKCHHMAALLICCHHNISVTDTPCQWSVPKQDETSCIKTIEEMYPLPQNYNCTTVKNKDDLKKEIYNKLSDQQCSVGLTWLLSPEPYVQDSLPQ